MTKPPIPAASGIVLAGGRSSRFGSDKLAETLRGRPLLDHAIAALAGVTTEVLVVVPPVVEAPISPKSRSTATVHIVRDSEPFGGPLVGLLSGLERAAEPLAIVVGGDMPGLEPAVLRAMLRALDNSENAIVALEFRGRVQPLPMSVRVGAVTPLARRLLGSGERSLRSVLTVGRAARLPEVDWRSLDPAAATLIDIDTRADLDRA